ncbi:hypothetical protein B4Q13_18360 [Lacticaseibacillus rhamnosus]
MGAVALSTVGAYAQGTKLPPGYDFRPPAAVVSSPFALGPCESRSLPGEDRDDPKGREEWFRHERATGAGAGRRRPLVGPLNDAKRAKGARLADRGLKEELVPARTNSRTPRCKRRPPRI